MVCQDCDGKLRQITDEPCSTFPEDSLFRSWLIDYTPAIRDGVANMVISMTAKYTEEEPAERAVGRFLREGLSSRQRGSNNDQRGRDQAACTHDCPSLGNHMRGEKDAPLPDEPPDRDYAAAAIV